MRLPILAALDLAGFQNRNEVSVLDLLRSAALVNESTPERLVLDEDALQDLERDLFPVGVAHGPEDDPHPSLAEDLLQAVRAKPPADLELAPP